MAGNDDDQDAAATNDEDDDACDPSTRDTRRTARYLYVKHRLPGESYEAFLKRLADELDTERTRRDDAGEHT